jgi:hypothetical protein
MTDRPFKSSAPEIEIISPEANLRLVELETQHAREAAHLERLESLANLMDAKFNVPLLPVPIGLDTIVGLIPGIGDTISLGVSSLIVHGAHRLDVPKRHLGQMGGNMFVDWLIGLVPLIGDFADIGWQANLRNVRITREQVERRWAQEREAAIYLPD